MFTEIQIQRIEIAIHAKNLSSVKHLITQESLTENQIIFDSRGLLYVIANQKLLHQLEPEDLTQENLELKDEEDITIFHLAARNGQLNCIPTEFLTQKNLTLKNNKGYTPLHWAIGSGTLDQVPAKVITLENLSITANNKHTVMHNAAASGNLKQIPENLWEKELLFFKSDVDYTPIHWAARNGYLDQIPPKILKQITKEDLQLKDTSGQNVIHEAYYKRNLTRLVILFPKIPWEFFEANLTSFALTKNHKNTLNEAKTVHNEVKQEWAKACVIEKLNKKPNNLK
jgi:ankyrin repeat protein